MRNKNKRIRYRRIPLFWPHSYFIKTKQQITKAKAKPSGQPNRTIQTELDLNSSLQTSTDPLPVTEGSLHQSSSASEHQGQALASEAVASFDPACNPYAYLVSQLPNILCEIPNLVKSDNPNSKEARPLEITGAPASNKASVATENNSASEHVSRREKPLNKKHDERQTSEMKSCSVEPVCQRRRGDRHAQLRPKQAKRGQARLSLVDPKGRISLASKRADTQWLAWQKTGIMPAKQAAFWCLLKKTNKRFLWPELSEQSCRQVRFGGRKAARTSALKPALVDPKFLGNLLNCLAAEHDCSLAKLLLLLSPVVSFWKFIVSSQVAQVNRPCLTMPATRVQDLTLLDYLSHAIDLGYLTPAHNYLESAVPLMRKLERLSLPISQLSALFGDGKQARLFKLTKTWQSIYVEVMNDQVLVYIPGHKAELWSLAHFHEFLACHPLSDEVITVQSYCKPQAINETLNKLVKLGKQDWQAQWQRNFNEFVISPEPVIDPTKLS